MKYGLIIFAISLLGCTNDHLIPVALQGKWVEINTRTDTLTFGQFGGQEALRLSRGNEMRGGFSLPKYGSGPYEYKLLTNRIALYWYLSSNSSFNDYYFNQIGNTILIGNFYDANSKGTVQTFKKL